MYRYGKRALLLTVLMGLILLCGGCGLGSAESLLLLPKVPSEYMQLQEQLSRILETGASYAVAEAGSNRQPVQLVDIDGDGIDEAMAFFQREDGSYEVHAFRQQNEQYVPIGAAEGFGSTLRAIYYPACGSGGQPALALCWGFDQNGAYGITVYGFEEDGLRMLLDMQYADVLIEDLDGNGAAELIFAVWDAATGLYSARGYQLQNGQYRQIFETALCLEIRSVIGMAAGRLSGHKTAIFIDSAATMGGYVTDMICWDGQTAVNRTIDPTSGSGSGTWRGAAAACRDMNGDGLPEIPVSHAFERETSEAEARYRLDWVNYGERRETDVVERTFYVPGEHWYLVWPGAWGDDVRAEKNRTSYAEQTNFYVEDAEGREILLSIRVFNSDKREISANLARRFHILADNANGIYCDTVPEYVENNSYQLTEEMVEAAFHPIETNWRTEEY